MKTFRVNTLRQNLAKFSKCQKTFDSISYRRNNIISKPRYETRLNVDFKRISIFVENANFINNVIVKIELYILINKNVT